MHAYDYNHDGEHWRPGTHPSSSRWHHPGRAGRTGRPESAQHQRGRAGRRPPTAPRHGGAPGQGPEPGRIRARVVRGADRAPPSRSPQQSPRAEPARGHGSYASARVAPRPTHNLPRPLTSFVGRQRELRRADATAAQQGAADAGRRGRDRQDAPGARAGGRSGRRASRWGLAGRAGRRRRPGGAAVGRRHRGRARACRAVRGRDGGADRAPRAEAAAARARQLRAPGRSVCRACRQVAARLSRGCASWLRAANRCRSPVRACGGCRRSSSRRRSAFSSSAHGRPMPRRLTTS